jgi:hypothetical protein
VPARKTTPPPTDPAAAYDHLASTADQDLLSRVTAYRPRGWTDARWAELGPLVRVALLALAPASDASATKYGGFLARHVAACAARGTDLSVPGVWAHAQVEHTLSAPRDGWSQRSMAVLDAPLRRVSRGLVPAGQPTPPPRRSAHPPAPPYRTAELVAVVDHVTTLAQPLWRARAGLLVALTAGAGLTDADLRVLTHGAVRVTGHAVVVDVPTGPRARTVPVHHGFEELALAAHTGLTGLTDHEDDDRLLPAKDPAAKLLAALAWPDDAARPTARRLRATWTALVLASGAGLPAFLRAAHLTGRDSWNAAVDLLTPLSDAAYQTQLRGTTGPVAATGRALDGRPWPAPVVPLRDDASPTRGQGA